MSRLLATAVLPLLFIAVAVAGDAVPGLTLNLNKPGALEALRHSNPAHYEKVHRIMDGLSRQRDAGVPRWMQAKFDAKDVRYGVLLTSNPPKRPLSFILDETRYRVVVTIMSNVSMVPVK